MCTMKGTPHLYKLQGCKETSKFGGKSHCIHHFKCRGKSKHVFNNVSSTLKFNMNNFFPKHIDIYNN